MALPFSLTTNDMTIDYGNGKTKYGPGVNIDLTGDEVALAVHAYLAAHDVYVNGPRIISVNGEMIDFGGVYVDPSGFVMSNGKKYSGRGK